MNVCEKTRISGLACWVAIFLVSGCRLGGSITAFPVPTPSAQPMVVSPEIALPFTNPYYSADSTLEIMGLCSVGSKISLNVDANLQQTCSSSHYDFQVTKNLDGVYFFSITQEDPKLKLSRTVYLTWIKKSSISSPVILTPSSNQMTYSSVNSEYTYPSSASTLTVSGQCEAGASVTLANRSDGSILQAAQCVHSTFSLSSTQSVEADFPLVLSQTDAAGNSSSVQLKWKHHLFRVNPPNASLVIQIPLTLTASGGSEVYTFAFAPSGNRSGSLNTVATVTQPPTYQYTPGTVANLSDTLRVTDSEGNTTDVSIAVLPTTPDHLILSNGSQQSSMIGHSLTTQPKVQIVDRFGNGVQNFEVYFQTTVGDGQIISPLPMPTPSFVPAVRSSDAQGFVQIPFVSGYAALNKIFVSPFSSILPDTAGTGNPTLTLSETSTTTGLGSFSTDFPNIVPSPTSNLKNPISVVTGNFTSDSLLDVAFLNNSNNTIGILVNRDHGSLQGAGVNNEIEFPGTCSRPVSVTRADFNQDGKTDLAALCTQGSDNGSVSLLFGDGTGLFPTQQVIDDLISSSLAPRILVAADFNVDGKPDLAFTSSVTNQVGILFGDGSGGFASASLFDFGDVNSAPTAMISADINKDGKPDLIVANSDSNLFILLNNGTGNFPPENISTDYPTGQDPVSIAAGDVNSDGNLDFVVGNTSDVLVTLFLSDSNGALIPQDIGAGTEPSAVGLSDLNGDGKLDLTVANSGDNQLEIYFNDGSNTPFATSPQFYPVASQPRFLAFTNDTRHSNASNILVLSSSQPALQLLENNGEGSFGFVTSFGQNANLVSTLSWDLNLDGNPDLISLNGGTKRGEIFLGNGNGLFKKQSSFLDFGTGAPSSALVGDFNRDGKPDIAVSLKVINKVNLFLGNGDGTFQTSADYSFSTDNGPVALAKGDFNKDSNLDLVVLNSNAQNFKLLLLDASGLLLSSETFSTASSPMDIAVVDLSDDGILDIGVTDSSDGRVSIFLGTGDSNRFATRVQYDVGTTPTRLLAGDVNKDGKVDFISLNTGDGTVGVLLGKGDGSFESVAPYSTSTIDVARDLAMGDFNADGWIDLAIAAGLDGVITVLNGKITNGVFSGFQTSNISPLTYGLEDGSLTKVIVSDFNIDGTLDLAGIDSSNSSIQIWMGNKNGGL